jgi:hypothetical protein
MLVCRHTCKVTQIDTSHPEQNQEENMFRFGPIVKVHRENICIFRVSGAGPSLFK